MTVDQPPKAKGTVPATVTTLLPARRATATRAPRCDATVRAEETACRNRVGGWKRTEAGAPGLVPGRTETEMQLSLKERAEIGASYQRASCPEGQPGLRYSSSKNVAFRSRSPDTRVTPAARRPSAQRSKTAWMSLS